MKRGVYDPALAVKAFSYAAQDGMRKYAKEFGGLGLQRGQVGKTKMAIAKELLDHYEDHLQEPMDETDDLENLDNADKSKLRQLESIMKSMDSETKQVASQMVDIMTKMENNNNLDELS